MSMFSIFSAAQREMEHRGLQSSVQSSVQPARYVALSNRLPNVTLLFQFMSSTQKGLTDR